MQELFLISEFALNCIEIRYYEKVRDLDFALTHIKLPKCCRESEFRVLVEFVYFESTHKEISCLKCTIVGNDFFDEHNV